MKKTIIKITTATVFTLMSFTAIAQEANRKPAIAEGDKSSAQDKTATTTAAPQIVTAPKAMTVKEQPKPIVPGGEFKLVDTNQPVKNYAKTPAPEKAPAPVPQVVQKEQ